MSSAVFSVDVGTSSTKAVLVSLDGRVLRSAVREHTVDRPRPGWAQVDAEVWWDEFTGLSRELLTDSDVDVAAVGLSGMGPCVLLTTADAHPLRPAILYGVDTRATQQVLRMAQRYGEAEVLRRCGSALSSQSAGPKIAWVHDEEPDVFREARRLFMPASWLAHQLTGEYVLDHHSASQCTPLYDTDRHEWYAPWAEDICPAVTLPELRWAGDVAGTVTERAARATSLPAGIPVITGTIDAWAEAISVGAHGVGDLMLMYGTTMFLINTVREKVTHPALWGTVGALPGTRNLAAGMAASGAITTWLRDLFGVRDYAELVGLAARSGPGANGLLMLPYFAGERTPILDPQARGVIAGLTLSHDRGDLYRAALEATGFGVRHNIETIIASGGEIRRVVAVGGGTTTGLWPQIVSDITQLPQDIPRQTIGASYGGALLAAQTVADVSIHSWNPIKETCEPHSELAGTYDSLYRDYRELYTSTRTITHGLAARQER